LQVGELGERSDAIVQLAMELAAESKNNTDSLLIAHQGKLVFESYFRRGRENMPHYQMSITKSYTALALGRAMQLGHVAMSDLDQPVVSFFNQLELGKLTPGAGEVSLHEVLHMHSGIRLNNQKVDEFKKQPKALQGQGQVQAYFECSAPITETSRVFQYQGSDPSIVMQVVEARVPGKAQDFIRNELLGPLDIEEYAWQRDTSGLPKAAAGSSMRSRDMVKFGLLVQNLGNWRGEQLIPEDYIKTMLERHDSNSRKSYGYFWHIHDMKVGDRTYVCNSARGAGGQYILCFPELDLVVVSTAHGRGMKRDFIEKFTPESIIPAFL
jgi:CubicO group peptidase (beta-lactamase class C family)